MTISRMQQPRQQYGLGSFVKKITRGAKKVLKSPLGKAALLYAGGAYLGGSTAMGGAGGSFMSRMATPKNLFNLKNILGNKDIAGLKGVGGKGIGRFFNPFNKGNPLLYDKGNFSGKRALLAAGIGATALPFFMGGEEEEEDNGLPFSSTPGNITDIVSQARASE